MRLAPIMPLALLTLAACESEPRIIYPDGSSQPAEQDAASSPPPEDFAVPQMPDEPLPEDDADEGTGLTDSAAALEAAYAKAQNDPQRYAGFLEPTFGYMPQPNSTGGLIPRPFRGRWDYRREACSNPDSQSAHRVTADTIYHGKAIGRVEFTRVDIKEGNGAPVDVYIRSRTYPGGEPRGANWVSLNRYALSDDRKELLIEHMDPETGDFGRGYTLYYRCPPSADSLS